MCGSEQWRIRATPLGSLEQLCPGISSGGAGAAGGGVRCTGQDPKWLDTTALGTSSRKLAGSRASLGSHAKKKKKTADAALADLCRASESAVARQLLPDFIVSHLPLTAAQWALVPVIPLPGLGRSLPAALASSVDQACQLVRRLPPADAQRLHTAALCLARQQRRMPLNSEERHPLWPEYLPPAAVERILSYFHCA